MSDTSFSGSVAFVVGDRVGGVVVVCTLDICKSSVEKKREKSKSVIKSTEYAIEK